MSGQSVETEDCFVIRQDNTPPLRWYPGLPTPLGPPGAVLGAVECLPVRCNDRLNLVLPQRGILAMVLHVWSLPSATYYHVQGARHNEQRRDTMVSGDAIDLLLLVRCFMRHLSPGRSKPLLTTATRDAAL